mgnify:CR=1 FL=1
MTDGSPPAADPRLDFRTRLGLDRTYGSVDLLVRSDIIDQLASQQEGIDCGEARFRRGHGFI